jgi:hypothetical protein
MKLVARVNVMLISLQAHSNFRCFVSVVSFCLGTVSTSPTSSLFWEQGAVMGELGVIAHDAVSGLAVH